MGNYRMQVLEMLNFCRRGKPTQAGNALIYNTVEIGYGFAAETERKSDTNDRYEKFMEEEVHEFVVK